jgi:methylmalonyl-CoA carboxyltransferase 5S subunit
VHAKKPAIPERPADLLKPEWESLTIAANTLQGANRSDEDVLTYAMFPQVATKFFLSRSEGRKNVSKDPSIKTPEPKTAESKTETAASGGQEQSAKVNYLITLNGKEHRVTVAPQKS